MVDIFNIKIDFSIFAPESIFVWCKNLYEAGCAGKFRRQRPFRGLSLSSQQRFACMQGGSAR